MVRRVANQIRLISFPSTYHLMRDEPEKNIQQNLCSQVLHSDILCKEKVLCFLWVGGALPI